MISALLFSLLACQLIKFEPNVCFGESTLDGMIVNLPFEPDVKYRFSVDINNAEDKSQWLSILSLDLDHDRHLHLDQLYFPRATHNYEFVHAPVRSETEFFDSTRETLYIQGTANGTVTVCRAFLF